jgi:hypothetical protein
LKPFRRETAPAHNLPPEIREIAASSMQKKPSNRRLRPPRKRIFRIKCKQSRPIPGVINPPSAAKPTRPPLAKTPSDQERAALTAQRKEAQAREGEVAMAEYQAALRAEREKTTKLRALRLAKEKRDAIAAEKAAEKAAAKAALKATAQALKSAAAARAPMKPPAAKAPAPKPGTKPAVKQAAKPATKPAKPKAAKGKKKK